MFPPYDPIKAAGDWTRLTTAYVQMSMAAAEVVWRRSLQMTQGAMTCRRGGRAW